MLWRILFLMALVPLFFGCSADSPSHTNDFIPVVSLSIISGSDEIAIQTSTRLTAIGQLLNGQSRDVTEDVAWTSSNDNIAFFDTAAGAENRLVGVSSGTVTVTATLDDLTAQAEVTVGDLSVEAVTIYPNTTVDSLEKTFLIVDETQQFSAIARMSDGSEQELTDDVTWFATDNDTEAVIATISNIVGSKGLVTAKEVGEATINAVYESIAIEQVALEVLDADLKAVRIVRTEQDGTTATGSSVPALNTAYFKAEADFSASGADVGEPYLVTKQATWSSSDPSVAGISARANDDGLMEVRALKAGKTTLFATFLGVRTSYVLTVAAIEGIVPVSLTIEPSSITVARFTSVPVRGILEYDNGATRDISLAVEWSVEDTDLAKVATGFDIALLEGRAAGNTRLVATYTDSVVGELVGEASLQVKGVDLVDLAVSVPAGRLHAGTTARLSAIGTFSDDSEQDVTYDVTWEIDPESGDLLDTVTVNTVLYPGWVKGLDDGSEEVTSDATVIARTSDGQLEATGVVTVDKTELDSISITPANPRRPVGSDQQFRAVGQFGGRSQDITLNVIWSLDLGDEDAGVAGIQPTGPNTGLAFGTRAGSFLIEASTDGLELPDLSALTTLNLE